MAFPPSIRTFAAFAPRLDAARTRVDELLRSMPGDATLENVRAQLAFAHGETRGGARPSEAALARLNFGMVAARELSDLDEALTRELAALQAFLDAWPADAKSSG